MLTAEHVLILNILKRGPIGRVFISKMLNIGEGKVRKILAELKDRGLIKSLRAGHVLSEEGFKVLSTIEKKYMKIVRKISVPSLNWQYAIEGIIRGKAIKRPLSKDGMEERDIMVRNGAYGAVISVYIDDEVRLPDSKIPLFEAIPGYYYDDKILKDLQEGDLLVIVGAENHYTAMYSFIKGAFSIIGGRISWKDIER